MWGMILYALLGYLEAVGLVPFNKEWRAKYNAMGDC